MTADQKKHMTGYRTIAVFGVDSRDGNVNKGTNADVIMLCNINRGTGEIKIVSIFRDTYLNINEGNTYNKINAAYANGGAAQALAAINRNLDLDVTEYVTFNWKSVADGINMLDGVDMISARQNSVISTPLLQRQLRKRSSIRSFKISRSQPFRWCSGRGLRQTQKDGYRLCKNRASASCNSEIL